MKTSLSNGDLKPFIENGGFKLIVMVKDIY